MLLRTGVGCRHNAQIPLLWLRKNSFTHQHPDVHALFCKEEEEEEVKNTKEE
jgi:hypothetical protein